MAEPARGRRSPCASCPYRLNAPTGIWAPEELERLPAYDRPTGEQPTAAFACHHTPADLCAGWLGHADPAELLAVRLGIISGRIDPCVTEYTTTVELHPSGAAAEAHGLQDRDQRSLRMLAGILLDRPDVAADMGLDL